MRFFSSLLCAAALAGSGALPLSAEMPTSFFVTPAPMSTVFIGAKDGFVYRGGLNGTSNTMLLNITSNVSV